MGDGRKAKSSSIQFGEGCRAASSTLQFSGVCDVVMWGPWRPGSAPVTREEHEDEDGEDISEEQGDRIGVPLGSSPDAQGLTGGDDAGRSLSNNTFVEGGG